MDIRTGRGPAGAPPLPPPQPARIVAAAVALAALALLAGGLAVHGASGRGAPGREPPFPVGPLHARDRSGARVTVPRSGILLYVDDDCPFCAIELARWAGAAARRAEVTLPTVILSPRSDGSASEVPARLRAGALHDADGSIARSLGVRSVPFRAVLDHVGTVVAVHAGLSSPARIDSLLDHPPARAKALHP